LKGAAQRNEIVDVCNEILARGLPESIVKLEASLTREKAKPPRSGGRKKRLRSLVEALADWWNARYGSFPKITARTSKVCDAKSSEKREAETSKKREIVAHEGPFLDLARALFCRVDEFNDTDVVATVQNVINARQGPRA
jgi:hypothetical protein